MLLSKFLIASDVSEFGVERLINFGVAGIFLVLFIFGVIVRGSELKEERAARIKSESYQKDVLIPLVQQMTHNQSETNVLLISFKRDRDNELDDLRKDLKLRRPTRGST